MIKLKNNHHVRGVWDPKFLIPEITSDWSRTSLEFNKTTQLVLSEIKCAALARSGVVGICVG